MLPGTDAGSNTPSDIPPAELDQDVDGLGTGCILVYTDDCSGNNPLIACLNQRGLAHTEYFQNPLPFEVAAGAGMYRLILVDHACHLDLSNAWDDLLAAYQGGASVGVASFDWDGSDDASGAVASLLSQGGATYFHDLPTQGDLHVWNPSPLFGGLPSTLTPTQHFYVDEGDGWNFTSAHAGWTTLPQQGEGSAVVGPNLVLLGFLPDQLAPSDGVTLWCNIIDYLISGQPTPAIRKTWGSLKLLYR